MPLELVGFYSHVNVEFGMPKGFIHRPIIFLLFTANLLHLVSSQHLLHARADDTQIYSFCQPSDVAALQQ
jgi:hypothetical protein